MRKSDEETVLVWFFQSIELISHLVTPNEVCPSFDPLKVGRVASSAEFSCIVPDLNVVITREEVVTVRPISYANETLDFFRT